MKKIVKDKNVYKIPWVDMYNDVTKTNVRIIGSNVIGSSAHYKEVKDAMALDGRGLDNTLYVAILDNGELPDASSTVRETGTWGNVARILGLQTFDESVRYMGKFIGVKVDDVRETIPDKAKFERYLNSHRSGFEDYDLTEVEFRSLYASMVKLTLRLGWFYDRFSPESTNSRYLAALMGKRVATEISTLPKGNGATVLTTYEYVPQIVAELKKYGYSEYNTYYHPILEL